MMTHEQRENWFTFHAPTDDTKPKCAAIRDAETAFIANVTQTVYEVGPDVAQLYREINRSALQMADVIDANAPDSADKTAAIRCVRLARNLFNEWATQRTLPKEQQVWNDITILFSNAEIELCKARMQACGAIACGGK